MPVPSTDSIAAPPRPRLAVRLAAVTFIVAILGALTLGITELALRSAKASEVYREVRKYPPHPFLQAVPVMAADHVNAQGFRGDAFDSVKPARTFRIFTIGGSTTLGVTNLYPDSYPAQLQALLRERHPDVNIEVQNAGCAWYTSAHALVSYVISVRQYQPDLVLFFEAINDMVRSFSPPWLAVGDFKPDYSHYLGPFAHLLGPNASFVDAPSSWLTWNVVRRWATGGPDPFDIRNKDNVASIASRLKAVDEPAFKSLPSFRMYSESIIHAVQSDGHAIMTASQPSLYRSDLSAEERRLLWFAPLLCADHGTCPSMTGMLRGIDTFNAAARDVAAARGVPFIDFAAKVPKTPAFFVDDVHLKKNANAILAREAADAIDAAGLVEKAVGSARAKSPER